MPQPEANGNSSRQEKRTHSSFQFSASVRKTYEGARNTSRTTKASSRPSSSHESSGDDHDADDEVDMDFLGEYPESFESARSLNMWSNEPRRRAFCPELVMTEANPLRRGWNLVVLFLLVYTATIFPYQLCFLDFKVPDAAEIVHPKYFDRVIDGLFYVDLVLNFFLSYKDAKGTEIIDLKLTAIKYSKTYLFWNILACIPPEIFDLFGASSGAGNVQKVARISRLQRMSRLARLVRLFQLSKLVRFMDESPLWLQFQKLRGVRIINLFVLLAWVCHMVCCGFYLCAALEPEPLELTWLSQRTLDVQGSTLLYQADGSPQKAEVQWLNAFYFILTVFTTVGFGDMSPYTNVEIGYVCCTMLLGAIINSIILNEVIVTLTCMDENASRVAQQTAVVRDFAEHCHLDPLLGRQLSKWAASTRAEKPDFNRVWMKEILTNGLIPSRIVRQLPRALFSGELFKNRFIAECRSRFPYSTPPRFHTLLALNLNQHEFDYKQVVYYCHDQAFSVYLVLAGVFASVAEPTPFGGTTQMSRLALDLVMGMEAKAKKRMKMQKTDSRNLEKTRKQDIKHDDEATQAQINRLSPYQYFCFGNYFGEVEILGVGEYGGQRSSTHRCESVNGGTLLQFHKEHLGNLIKDFPLCLRAWQTVASKREKRRLERLKQLTTPTTLEALASSAIQEAWRQKAKALPRPSGRGTESLPNSSSPRKPRPISVEPERHHPPVSPNLTFMKAPPTPVLSRGESAMSMASEAATTSLAKEVDGLKSQMKGMQGQVGDLRCDMARLQESLNGITQLLLEGRERTPMHAAQGSEAGGEEAREVSRV
eukprot:TRINITY_DN109392_c0_g1_i1.p1 TRINITY_DN109392_c0_g1~~TRINITY_DN109392_c0_g1_i1.p1  ORF type:complete len:821 (+),score=133.80 TRINITY_DN109392_c0_g1_i1:52-2514(+)